MLKAIFIAVASLCALASPAFAQAPKIFVASTGNDANDGGRATPKRSFQAAHDAVVAGGEIVVLDTSGYGTLTITKSVAIVVPPGVTGFITAPAGGTGVTIAAGDGATVSLSGLIIEGPADHSVYGIKASSVGTLVVDRTIFRQLQIGMYLKTQTIASRTTVRSSAFRDMYVGIDGEVPLSVAVSDTEFTDSDVALQAFFGAQIVATRTAIQGAGTALSATSGASSITVDACTLSNPKANATAFNATSGATIYTRNNNTVVGYLPGQSPVSLPAQ